MGWVKSPEQMKRRSSAYARTASRAESEADRAGAPSAERLAKIHRDYSFLPAATKYAMAAGDVPEDEWKPLAEAELRRRLRTGFGSAGFGDIVKGAFAGVAKGTDFVVPEAVERFVGRVKDKTVDRVAEAPAVREVARNFFAELQAPQEFFDHETRKLARNVREQGWVGALLDGNMTRIKAGEDSDSGLGNYTIGQIIEGKDAGSGFLPGGEAREAQAERAREFGTINGQAITLGRLTASTVFQPGSKPYNTMSGVIDLIPEVYDPSGAVLKAVSRTARSARGLTGVVSEASVVRAAEKAGDEGAALRELAGMVDGGPRRTVVPAAVDKYLFSDHANVRLDILAETSSPAAVWRRMNKRVDVEVAKDIAAAPTRADVLGVVRPAVGLGLDPRALRSSRFAVVPSLQRHARAFNIVPETLLPIDDPNTLIRNLDNTLASANVMGKERDRIIDLAFDTVVGVKDPAGGLKNLADVAGEAIRASMVAHGADPETARNLTRWTGQYHKISKFLADESHSPVNLPFLLDDAGKPITGSHPSALYQLLNRGIPLLQQSDLREVRQLTSMLNRVGVHSKAVQMPVAVADYFQGGIWKMAVMVRPAYLLRVPGEEVVRSLGSGMFDNPLDWVAYAFGHRGAGDLKGNPFDLAKEADSLLTRAKKIEADSVDDLSDAAKAEVRKIEDRLTEIQEEMLLGKTEYQNASARGNVGKSSAFANEDTRDGFTKTGIRQDADRVHNPTEWRQGAADYLIAQSTDPIIKRVANGGLIDGDRVQDARPADALIQTLSRSNQNKGLDIQDLKGTIAEVDSLVQRFATPAQRALMKDPDRLAARVVSDHYDELSPAAQDFIDSKATWTDLEAGTRGVGLPRDGLVRGSHIYEMRARLDDLEASLVADEARLLGWQGGPVGLDGIREWLLNGTGVIFRRRLEAAYPGVNWKDPKIIDQYLAIQVQHVKAATGDIADLRQALVTGRINGRPIASASKKTAGRSVPTETLKARVAEFIDDPHAPQSMPFEALARNAPAGMFGKAEEARQAAMNAFFGNLYGAVSDTLARHPVFKKSYSRWVDEHVGWLSQEARDAALTRAEKWGLSKREINSLKSRMNAMPVGQLTADDADMWAKGVALDEANKLLFDASQKSQFFDITRIIFPFGEAWKEVSTRWAKLLTTQPNNIRRAQQVVTGARGADVDGDGKGFFHPDPVTGEEMFAFGIDGPLLDYLGVDGIHFEGSVKGLTMGTQTSPGLGHFAQFPLSAVVEYLPNEDFIRDVFLPFGTTETSAGGLVGGFVPRWLDKAIQTYNADPRKDEDFARAMGEMIKVLAASGDYGNNRDEKARLMRDAISKAKIVTGMSAMFSAFAPSAPQAKYTANTKKGDVVAGELTNAYYKFTEQEDKGEIDSAIEAFMDTYGEGAFAYLISKTTSNVGGQKASSEYGAWENDHGGFIDKYPEIAGYFGPPDEGIDFAVFGGQQDRGRRESRPAKDILNDRDQLIGSWMWRASRDKEGPNPGPNARKFLAAEKAWIREQYPAWNPSYFPAGVVEGRIEALADAAEDKAVRDTPVAAAIREYMAERAWVSSEVIARGLGTDANSFAKVKKARRLRDYLRDMAASIIADQPAFKRVWEQVLEPELDDDLEREE